MTQDSPVDYLHWVAEHSREALGDPFAAPEDKLAALGPAMPIKPRLMIVREDHE